MWFPMVPVFVEGLCRDFERSLRGARICAIPLGGRLKQVHPPCSTWETFTGIH